MKVVGEWVDVEVKMPEFHGRASRRGMYGRVIYFTSEACKVMQYCGTKDGLSRTMVLARVFLGHPCQHCGDVSCLTALPWL